MKSKGLKAETVKYTNIDPAARVGMLAAKKIPAIETFAMSLPGVVKAVGGTEAQMFLLANNGLSLYSNGILVREDYLKAERRQGEGLRQGFARRLEGRHRQSEGSGRHRRQAHQGSRPGGDVQEIIIVNALVATPDTRAKGLGTIDAKLMGESVDLIANGIGAGGKVAAKDVYDTSALPQPPIKP